MLHFSLETVLGRNEKKTRKVTRLKCIVGGLYTHLVLLIFRIEGRQVKGFLEGLAPGGSTSTAAAPTSASATSGTTATSTATSTTTAAATVAPSLKNKAVVIIDDAELFSGTRIMFVT